MARNGALWRTRAAFALQESYHECGRAMRQRIQSWKGIAEYLHRGTRTVQRWEREEGLPVHRLQHEKLGSIYAYADELDSWWSGRRDHAEGSEAQEASVAVLPFADLSREQDQEYFCDGMAEEIIGALAKLHGLRVASRGSSFRFRGKSVDVGAAARQLKVGALLEGSVRKHDGDVRISVQLIDGRNGYHLWGANYDRKTGDIFGVQEDIARSVARELEVTLTVKESEELGRVRTRDMEAYDAYLRGRSYYYRYGPQDMEFAIQMFLQATAQDPKFAPAWAGLADCWSYLYLYSERNPLLREQAAWAAAEAVKLDRGSAQGWASLALAQSLMGDDAKAEESFAQAVALDANLFEAWYFRARHAFARGRREQALGYYLEAIRVRPEDYQSPLLMAQIYDDLGRHEDACRARRSGIAQAQEHLRHYPDDVRALYCSANGMAALGEAVRAREFAERALAARPKDGMTLYNIGCVYALLGNREDALAVLERAVDCGLRERGWFENDSNLDTLRELPRFQQLLADL